MNARTRSVRAALKRGETLSEIARRLGVSRQRADQIANPEKHRARKLVGLAVKSGALSRPALCSACGQPGPTQAHHNDYSKPLDISWLCAFCHSIIPKPKRVWRTLIRQARSVEPAAPADAVLHAVVAEEAERQGRPVRLARRETLATLIGYSQALRTDAHVLMFRVEKRMQG